MGKRVRGPGIRNDVESGIQSNPAKRRALSKKSANQAQGGKGEQPIRSSLDQYNISHNIRTAQSKTKIIDKPSKPHQDGIVVGIDYGTTYSGIAYMSKSERKIADIRVLTDLPGATRRDELREKAPSITAYVADNPDIGEDKHGYEVEPGMKAYSQAKLLLDANARQTEFDHEDIDLAARAGVRQLPVGKTAEEVVSDYLRYLYDHTMAKLEKRLTSLGLERTSIEFWFTIPATWQESSKQSTRSAARSAGFGARKGDKLYLITEPESAALAVLSQEKEAFPNLYKEKTNVLIADLGGGTLDLQCLTIDSLKPLKTHHTISGIGGKSGSTLIDMKFCEWMEATFNKAYSKLPIEKIGPGSRFMQEWEIVKKSFTGKDLGKTFQVYLPALGNALREEEDFSSTAYDFDENHVLVSGHDIAQMFRPVMDAAFRLVEQQVAELKKLRKPTFELLILCGGLGSSEYVWNRFEKYCRENLKNRAKLVTDDRAWSAVVRGAVIRGLNGNFVVSKICRRWFGIEVHQAFREGVDREEDSWICPSGGGKRAPGYVSWVVERNKRITEGFHTESKFYLSIDPNAHDRQKIFNLELYSCASDTAPHRVDQPGVEYDGQIKIDLCKRYKSSKASRAAKPGHEMVDLRVVLDLSDAKGVLLVKVKHKTTVVGEGKIEFSKDRVRQSSDEEEMS